MLELNRERIRWRRIDDLVQAFRIAQGNVPPAGYYKAIVDDETQAAVMMGNDLLGGMMRHG